MTVTKGPAMAAVSRMIRCQFVDDDTNPSPFDFPIRVSVGSSRFATYVGSGLATTLVLVLLPQLVSGLVFFFCGHVSSTARGPFLATLQRKLLANAAVLTLAYFGPLTFKLPFLILWHSSSTVDGVIAVLCPLLVLILVSSLCYCVVRLAPMFVRVFQVTIETANDSEYLYENRFSGSLFIETFGLLFESARSTSLLHRLLYFEDFAVAAVLQILDGVHPERISTCRFTAALLTAMCITHLLYLCATRPYGDRIELILAIVGSLIMSVTGLLGLTVTLTEAENGGDDTGVVPPSATLIAFGYAALINNGFFVLQAVVLGLVALAKAHKARLELRAERATRKEERRQGMGKVIRVEEMSFGTSPSQNPGKTKPPSDFSSGMVNDPNAHEALVHRQSAGSAALTVPLLDQDEVLKESTTTTFITSANPINLSHEQNPLCPRTHPGAPFRPLSV